VKVDKLELAEWLKHLSDIVLGEVEMQGTDVESALGSGWGVPYVQATYCMGPDETPGGRFRLLKKGISLRPDPEHAVNKPSMCAVTFGFGVLDPDRETHHHSATQIDGLVDILDRTQLNIANTASRSARDGVSWSCTRTPWSGATAYP
jgi:hypothetical protein